MKTSKKTLKVLGIFLFLLTFSKPIYAENFSNSINIHTALSTESPKNVDIPSLSPVTGLEATGVGKNCVTLIWNAVPEAQEYLIYRQQGNGTFSYLDTTQSPSYSDTTASGAEYNFYRIYPAYTNENEQIIGPSNTYVYAKAILSPASNLKASSIGKNKIKLTWNSVKDAEGYIIYRQIGNTSLSYLYITPNTSYIDTTASGAEYNFYRIYPYYKENAKNITGPSTSYVYAKAILNPVQNLKAVSAGKNCVKLTWNSVSGADGYIIYRQIDNTSFSYRDITPKTSYLDDATAADGKYTFYRIYPYYKENGKNVIGASTKYVYAKGILPAVTNLQALPYGKEKVKISWNAVSDADGYIIYRQTNTHSFSTIGISQDTFYIDTNATGMDYNFYRVYPYHLTNTGNTIQGKTDTYVYAKAALMPITDLKIKCNFDSLELKWSQHDEADEYRIYRKIGNGSFQHLSTVKGTHYIDKNSSKESYNFYRVYPCYYENNKSIMGQPGGYVYGIQESTWVDSLNASETCTQLIIVSVYNHNHAEVSMHTKTGKVWEKIFSTSGRVGYNGINKQYEGDGKTPSGLYGLHTPFGIKENPGCPIGYTQVNYNHYWGGMPAKYYNQLIDITTVDDYKAIYAEHLIDYGDVYNYCVAIDYNPECIVGKGGAIFLHCSGKGTTAGCVSIPEANMITVLKNLRQDSQIIIDYSENITSY